MSRTRFVTAVIAAILPSASAFAGTYAVGTCLPKTAFLHDDLAGG